MAKQIGILISVILVIMGGVIGFSSASAPTLTPDSFLRIHIRANSNDTIDQAVKYQVKDALVNYLTPILAEATTKTEAMQLVSQNLDNITEVARLTLEEHGYNYGAKAELRREEFPTRCYDDVVLESGEYDSLIVELGSGTGNNWWCVVYPPLCFVNANLDGSQGVVYRSKIVEIIKSFFN